MQRLVTLDFTNTCARVSNTVGYHYALVAAECGLLSVETVAIDKHFKLHFQQQMKRYPNFGAYNSSMTCRHWWSQVVTDTFKSSCGLTGPMISDICDKLYDRFTKPDCWVVFDDVRDVLSSLREQHITVGIVSNFDDRLELIIHALELDRYIDFVITSYNEKCHKPNPEIFKVALAKAQANKYATWHIGNDMVNDYYGARSCGINSLLLNREKKDIKDIKTVTSLTEALNIVTN